MRTTLNTIKTLIANYPDRIMDVLDSLSVNQYASKDWLIEKLNEYPHHYRQKTLDKKIEVSILGSWYGSILIPAFKQVKRITSIDVDDKVIRIAKQRLFKHYTNTDFITADVFNLGKFKYGVENSNLIINTSCEHMRSMKELDLNTNAYFAFQSNNMFDIPTHTNCVHCTNNK